MATKTKNSFKSKVLAVLNKTKEEVQEERVQEFVETAIIDLNEQISQKTTGTIPRLKHSLEKAKNTLKKEENNLEKVRFSLALSTEEYIDNRQSAEDKIDSAKEEINRIEAEIKTEEAIIEKLKSYLADFEA